jgi:hypothetical protein
MASEFFAPAGVVFTRDKKERDDSEVDDVSHVHFDFPADRRSFSRIKYECRQPGRVIKRRPWGVKIM